MPRLPIAPGLPGGTRPEPPVFYYDLGDPHCYLMAEEIMAALPVAPEWEPVSAASLRPNGPRAPAPDPAEVQRRAAALGLQPFRWPEPCPVDSRQAMLAATYAKRIGRGVAFSLAAFRQAFAGGRDLADEDTILIAGAACEMHPAALLKGIVTRTVAEALEAAALRARQAGVVSLPAIQVGHRVFGDLEPAADTLR